MHILILNWRDTNNPQSGGAEIVTMEHAKAWVRAGNRVTWLSAHFPGAKSQETINGVTFIRRGGSLTVYLWAIFVYLRMRNTVDIVIDEIHGIPFFTPLYVRKPKIAFIHEIAGEIWDYVSIFPFNKIGKLLESIYFQFYQSVPFWTDAESTIEELVSHGIKRSQCRAIACPSPIRALRQLPKKEKHLTLIFVSRLVKMKGVEEVIRAFSYLSDLDAQLWVVGGGEEKYLQSLQALVSTLGVRNVRFYGKVSSQRKIYLMRQANILLHASIKEGWGLVVVEAASQGTPAIVYNVPGLRESVINGKTGIVLTKNTPEEMAHQIRLLLHDTILYTQIQRNCLNRARDITWSKVTQQSLELLAECNR